MINCFVSGSGSGRSRDIITNNNLFSYSSCMLLNFCYKGQSIELLVANIFSTGICETQIQLVLKKIQHKLVEISEANKQANRNLFFYDAMLVIEIIRISSSSSSKSLFPNKLRQTTNEIQPKSFFTIGSLSLSQTLFFLHQNISFFFWSQLRFLLENGFMS